MGFWQTRSASCLISGECSVALNMRVCSRAAPFPPFGSRPNSRRIASCSRKHYQRECRSTL